MSKLAPHPVKNHKSLTIFCTILLLILSAIAMYLIVYHNPNQTPNHSIYVSKIIDGDTFELSNGEIVRLICIDTPEINQIGYEEATTFLRGLLLNEVARLENPQISNPTDSYNRSLRWVYVNISEEEILVNKEIVRLGFGEILEFNEGECDIINSNFMQ